MVCAKRARALSLDGMTRRAKPRLLTWIGVVVSAVLALSSGNAARIFGLSTKGRLAVGADADLAVVETGGPWHIDPSTWLTRSRETAAGMSWIRRSGNFWRTSKRRGNSMPELYQADLLLGVRC